MFRKALIVFSLMLIFGVLLYDSAHTHSGRTDANGGHYNRKTGEYHYHNSGRARARLNTNQITSRINASTNAGVGTSLMSYPTEVFFADTAYQVTRIIDGNTVEIQYGGKLTSVVLIGVDILETVHPEKSIETFGKEATTFIKNLLKGESVYLRFDSNRTDKYGRLLAYLYRAPDGLFVNLEIVRQGYGRAYTEYPFKFMELFQHYGTRAQAAGKGLYSETTVETPSRPQEKQESVTVYVTRTGSKYHKAGCTYLRWSKIPILLEEAKERYSPCSRCEPPHSLLNGELKKLPAATNPNLRLDRAWLNRIYPNSNKASTAKVSTENQSSKPKISSSKYPPCKVCGGGSVITKYGKKSHSSTCRYVTNTKYPTRSTSSYSSGTVRVKGYYRKDGTYVRPHTRRKPSR